MRKFVPGQELQTISEKNARSYLIRELTLESKPSWIPYSFAAPFARWFVNAGSTKSYEQSMQRAIKLMYDRGIRLVMGSDSGNWPVLTSYFHAYGTIRELELLAEAEIPLDEIIRMSTSRAAEMIGLDGAKGTLAIGKDADIVVLKENPLKTAHAYRSVQFVIKSGVVHAD